MKVKSLSRARLLATSWTAAYQAPPSMGFSRQEYWSGVPLPSPLQLYKGLTSPHAHPSLIFTLYNWLQLLFNMLSAAAAAAAAKSLQSCLTLCDPIDGSPPGSPIPGILQAKIL